jgi:feruloyl-CoA synthase
METLVGAMSAANDTRVVVRPLPGGGWELRHPDALVLPARRVGDWLEHWAATRPEHPFLVDPLGAATTYADARTAVGQLAQGLLDRAMPVGAPLVIVAENSVAHALLALAAMHVGIPVCTLAPSWVQAPAEAERVSRVLALLAPGRVVDEALLRALPRPAETAAVAEAFAAVRSDSIARYLLTSGSTDAPKLVSTTQGMLTANQAQIAQVWPFVTERPVVLCDWLPWSHTFGASHNVNLVLAQGGTLHLDDGRPTGEGIARSAANLARVRPTLLFNVPRGYAMLLPLLEADESLARAVLDDVDMVFCAAAALDPVVRDRIVALGDRVRERPLWFAAGWGATETAPAATLVSWPDADPQSVGLPVPGCVLRLTPAADGYELRVRGPNVTPGYLGASAEIDAEGFWCSGDAADWVDGSDHGRGLRITGRIAEDFKLSSGTWVSVASVRAAALARLGVMVEDVVVLGPDRADVRLLVFPSAAGVAVGVTSVQQHCDAVLREWQIAERGSSRVPVRALVTASPLDASRGEVTAKGSVNQRVLRVTREEECAVVYGLRVERMAPAEEG